MSDLSLHDWYVRIKLHHGRWQAGKASSEMTIPGKAIDQGSVDQVGKLLAFIESVQSPVSLMNAQAEMESQLAAADKLAEVVQLNSERIKDDISRMEVDDALAEYKRVREMK